MKVAANNPDEYVANVQEKHHVAIKKLRETIQKNLPKGFEECMSYGMIGYVVPHSLYPKGYHVKPELPLPFINIASQKNFVALYHSGIYAQAELYDWFVSEYGKRVSSKLDMGKSCVRMKKPDDIPFDLIAELCQKLSPKEWIEIYESNLQKAKK